MRGQIWEPIDSQHGERQLSASTKHARGFCSSPFRAAKMMHAEVHHYGIEGATRKRQALGIALPKLDLRVESLGKRDHLSRKVEPSRCGATAMRPVCDISWPRAEVE
jgi:hypothetical protein